MRGGKGGAASARRAGVARRRRVGPGLVPGDDGCTLDVGLVALAILLLCCCSGGLSHEEPPSLGYITIEAVTPAGLFQPLRCVMGLVMGGGATHSEAVTRQVIQL